MDRIRRTAAAARALHLAALLPLVGCAASLATVQERYAVAEPTCETLAGIPLHGLPVDRQGPAFELDESAPLFAFETGRSYFHAFEVPADAGLIDVTVSSYVIGDSPSAWYIFFPQVLVLDADFAPRHTIGPEAFHWHEAGMFETPGWRKKLEAELQLSPADGDRYLVVLTTDELLRQVTPVEVLQTVGGVVSGVPLLVPTGYREVAVQNAPMGRLRVRAVTRGG